MVDRILSEHGRCRIIDLGGTSAYWRPFEAELAMRNLTILIVNPVIQAPISACFTSIIGDATGLPGFDDNSFEIVHSNSVIEHVGDRAAMARMAAEVRRLAPACFVQTPNFWFPYEAHARTLFFHWLPVRARVALLMRRNCGFYPRARTREQATAHVNDAACLSRRELRRMFPDAAIMGERVFGLVKSWMVLREATG